MGDLVTKKFRRYLYDLENAVDEFVIVFLSLGAILVSFWSLFVSTSNYNMVEFGQLVAPWIVMLALMIIARELWLLNRRISHYLEQQQGE
ncbi:MAG: hypothetical protein ABEK04_02675 [Candidatus Nanohalobium sp.]